MPIYSRRAYLYFILGSRKRSHITETLPEFDFFALSLALFIQQLSKNILTGNIHANNVPLDAFLKNFRVEGPEPISETAFGPLSSSFQEVNERTACFQALSCSIMSSQVNRRLGMIRCALRCG